MATTTQRTALRTFHGPTMAQALAEVKRDLGPEAVILHTRTYRVGGVMGVGARPMVEITASADAGVLRPKRIRPRAPERAGAGGVRDAGLGEPGQHAGVATTASEFIPTPPWFDPRARAQADADAQRRPTPENRAAPEPAPVPPRAEPESSPRSSATPAPAPPRPEARSEAAEPSGAKLEASRVPTTRVEPAPTNARAQAVLEEELSAIRRLVGQVLQSSRRAEARAGVPSPGSSMTAPSVSTGPLFDLYLRLLDSKVSAEVADGLASAVRDELSAGELADADSVRGCMLRQIARRMRVVGEEPPPQKTASGRPHVSVLVGPTGVGKTTTVAKLAATYKLRYGRRVGLVTADTYRIAAVEQLRTYADIVGLPLKVVLSPQEVGPAIDSLSECDIVLVDTAGRSQHDASRLGELAEFLEAAAPDSSHLVLSLAAAESVIIAAAERFAALKPGRLILSKLDETVDFGVIANIAAAVGLPISHVTTGQEVPDHLERANPDRLARLVLDGADAWSVLTGGR